LFPDEEEEEEEEEEEDMKEVISDQSHLSSIPGQMMRFSL
jgi:hypothetical protein